MLTSHAVHRSIQPSQERSLTQERSLSEVEGSRSGFSIYLP
ncbi:hypothetical protein [Nostoc sp.]